MSVTVSLICVLAFVINLPFGYLRSRVTRFSLKWFLYIHLPIPIIIVARLFAHLDFRYIPVLVLAAVMGQFFGGKL